MNIIKYFLNLSISFLIIFSSCTKAEYGTNKDIVNNSNKLSESLADISNSLLTFASVEELEETASMLLKMNNEDRKLWYSSKGFTSAEQVLILAEEELELIKNIEDVKLYKNKYSKYFIFDENKIEINANPYLKIGKFGYSYVCNINGDVIINNEIYNYNDLTSYEETSDSKIIF